MATIDDVYNLLVTVDGKIDDIKAKTDQLAFTSGRVDANVTSSSSEVVLGGERFADFTETIY
jgi:hypothetical protein